MNSVRQEIESRLATLNPAMLEVVDESAAHAGHAGAKAHRDATGATDGTHLAVTIVSAAFKNKTPLARHRLVYALLEDLMKTRIHALRIDARPA